MGIRSIGKNSFPWRNPPNFANNGNKKCPGATTVFFETLLVCWLGLICHLYFASWDFHGIILYPEFTLYLIKKKQKGVRD